MRILFYFGHPAQYLFLRKTIEKIQNKNHKAIILIKSKDVLENLLKNDGQKYLNILPYGRKDNKLSIFISLLKRDFKVFNIVKRQKIDLLIGGDPSLAHVGRLLKIPSISITEDDYEVISTLAHLTFPFSKHILAPFVCNVGKWNHKKISYNGYMKLAYLHPNIFTPNRENITDFVNGRYFIIRTTKLKAHHDFGINGLTKEIVLKIIQELSKTDGKVFISSEEKLDRELEKYKLSINPSHIHDFLYYADLLISDSQSMSVEAAMLGTPSIRYSDFAGKISVLEELENQYGLTFGIKTSEPAKLFKKIEELLVMPNLKEEWQKRRLKMLSEKIDVTSFMVWFIENYPESVEIMKRNPSETQDRFR